MSNLKVGKPTKQEEAAILAAVIESETSKQDTQLVERDGVKYLVRTINGLTIETRMA